MYRVVLVDDEEWILLGLEKAFDWNRLGFELVGRTSNSLHALQMIFELAPDVVVTDVMMPELTGLELLKRVKLAGLDCTFVIVSGFAEFSYVQDALRNDAFDYWLKPVRLEEGETALLRLKEYLDARKSGGGVAEFNRLTCSLEGTLNTTEEREPHQNEAFLKLTAYVEEHFDEKLVLKDLCKQFYINLNYCCELYRKEKGRTFVEHLTELRMNAAVKLLNMTDMDINRIAERVGFKDYYYFNRTFTRHFGVPPARFRRTI